MNCLYAKRFCFSLLWDSILRGFQCLSLIGWETLSLKPHIMLQYMSYVFVMDFGMYLTKLVLKEKILKWYILSNFFNEYHWRLKRTCEYSCWCGSECFNIFPSTCKPPLTSSFKLSIDASIPGFDNKWDVGAIMRDS